MEELLEVMTFHLPRYENTIVPNKTRSSEPLRPNICHEIPSHVSVYQGERITSHDLPVFNNGHVNAAKENGGFIDQKAFKTAGKYGFDSLILTDTSMQVLNGYINFVRPLIKPQYDFVLVTRNGGQHSKLGDMMNKLVFDAIGKYVHPTRYRQIVETQSLHLLTHKEQRILSEDQKHGSAVAKVHYQKHLL